MAAKFTWKLLGKDAAKYVLTFNPKKNQWGFRQMGQPLNFTQKITSGQAGRLAKEYKIKLPGNLGLQTRARTTPSASSLTPRQQARKQASQITTLRQDWRRRPPPRPDFTMHGNRPIKDITPRPSPEHVKRIAEPVIPKAVKKPMRTLSRKRKDAALARVRATRARGKSNYVPRDMPGNPISQPSRTSRAVAAATLASATAAALYGLAKNTDNSSSASAPKVTSSKRTSTTGTASASTRPTTTKTTTKAPIRKAAATLPAWKKVIRLYGDDMPGVTGRADFSPKARKAAERMLREAKVRSAGGRKRGEARAYQGR